MSGGYSFLLSESKPDAMRSMVHGDLALLAGNQMREKDTAQGYLLSERA
jgi:hypothetical protein